MPLCSVLLSYSLHPVCGPTVLTIITIITAITAECAKGKVAVRPTELHREAAEDQSRGHFHKVSPERLLLVIRNGRSHDKTQIKRETLLCLWQLSAASLHGRSEALQQCSGRKWALVEIKKWKKVTKEVI